MKDLIERLRAQASAHRYMGEFASAELLDEAVAALEEAEKKPEPATLSLHANIEADRRYLEQLAAHFDDRPVPEIKAHRQRLISIANKLV
jgi:hypothetical protein